MVSLNEKIVKHGYYAAGALVLLASLFVGPYFVVKHILPVANELKTGQDIVHLVNNLAEDEKINEAIDAKAAELLSLYTENGIHNSETLASLAASGDAGSNFMIGLEAHRAGDGSVALRHLAVAGHSNLAEARYLVGWISLYMAQLDELDASGRAQALENAKKHMRAAYDGDFTPLATYLARIEALSP